MLLSIRDVKVYSISFLVLQQEKRAMVRYGSPEWQRRRYIHFMMFLGLFMVILNGQVAATSGRLWGDVWIVGGVVIFVVGLLLLMRERVQEVNNLRVEMPS